MKLEDFNYNLIFWVIIIIIVFACMVLFFVNVYAEIITLTWDPPEQHHDGVRIYQKTAHEGDNYNYDTPIADVLYPNTSATVEVMGEKNAVLKYQWVARAYRDDIESIDSNEVSYKVINIPPITPVGLSARYQNDTITLTWDQPTDGYYINHWLVYFKRNDGQFIPLGRVNEGNELEILAHISGLAPAGEISELIFTVVAYRRSGIYSANSVEASITINRQDVEPVQNLRIEINIPVSP